MVLGVTVFGVASWAWAMPAPKDVDELDALADIVVDVRRRAQQGAGMAALYGAARLVSSCSR